MTYTYAATGATTDLSKVRRRISDTDSANPIFTDEEINGFFASEGNYDGSTNWKRAAAMALETMATSEAYVQKVMRLMDIQTNGAAVAASLRADAVLLRTQSDIEEANLGGQFDWAEQVGDDFGARERLLNQALRGLV